MEGLGLKAIISVSLPWLQEFEFTVSRDQDERQYNIDEGTRVYVHVNPQAMMGFNPEDVDSAPIV